MAYVWNPTNNSALRFSINANENGNIAQDGDTATGTKSKAADIFKTDITADNAITVQSVFADLFGFIANTAKLTKTDSSTVEVE